MTRADPPTRVVETHSAVLVMMGDRVHKLKKPVDLGFLDFSSVEARAEACRREVELNRRLAPDVYLGVEEVRDPDGEVCEHMVLMRRMPPERRLSHCLGRGEDLSGALRVVADDVAALHARSAPAGPMASVATRDAVRRLWTDGFERMRPHVGSLVDEAVQERIEQSALRYLDGRDALFERRIAQGQVRDGHGDLQAEDIFVLDDGPRVLDCLEFDDALRWSDVLADVAFLAMDLERLGHPGAAEVFLEAYRHRAGAQWPPSLAHHYIAYRAHVRAKVGVIREVQTGEPTPGVDALQDLCLRHLGAGRVRLVLVGGLPGTGKSTTAAALGRDAGAVVLRSDRVRRTLPSSTRYDASSTDEVYERLLADAGALLGLGEHVVVDATWSDERHRRAARRLAERSLADVIEIECRLPAEVAAERILDRLAEGTDLSEATPDVAASMSQRFAPWPEAAIVATDGGRDEARRSAMRACGW